jgi:hypothetical protein
MASAEERRASAEIGRNLKSISDELKETNYLLKELLKFQLRHEGERKESAEK